MAEEFCECSKALAAIGDETRQSIIIALIEGESINEKGIRVGELTQRTNLSSPAVSHHLKILKEANLIGYDQEGTKKYYYLDVLKSDIFRLKKLFDHIDEFIKDSQETNENTINDEG
ncbi:hypothetical protein BSK52_27750 [Paenibacillus odorifer]|uniref:HTH arsR-type domain-containing protein n=1 Tax=Paenibacillus odorifer TaxID=189426 RepID=A0A1R0XJ79_9BACL|nr:metalloregulator ArsR/SmtB family transcription factor [Paenibacillus odorifer]OMD35164.1 hypothetical protein BSK52_27750 [Paenibacillus odorifer]